jgi:quercetin dioxygenase-like cupin family protein
MFTIKNEGPVAKGARRRKTFKLLLAGVVVTCVCGIALRFAWATPGAGVTSATTAGPVLLDEIDVEDHGPDYGIKIKAMKGASQCRIVHYSIAPGGHTGWHSHPGPVFVMITAGTMTKEEADGSIAEYPAGTGFVEGVGHPHIARNEGTVDLVLDAFFLTPLSAGNVIRNDEPAP